MEAAAPLRFDYDFAVLRVVPRVHIGMFVNVGVIVHARTSEYLALLAETDAVWLASRVAPVDVALLGRYLASCRDICAGRPSGGAVALAPPSERFHWLTAPRSDVIQSSPVHEGVCQNLELELERLFRSYVTGW